MNPPRRRMRIVWWMTWADNRQARFYETEAEVEAHVAELLQRKDVAVVWSGEVELQTSDYDLDQQVGMEATGP